MFRRSIVWLLLVCAPAVLSADLVPLGDERVVATAPDDGYVFYSPDSAPRGSGFVVTWSSAFTRYSGSELIDWGAGIYGRRIAADGRPAGERLALVPEADKVDIGFSSVASDAAGRYAVVWGSANEGHPQLFVRLRQFSPTGAAVSTVLADRFGRGRLDRLPPPAAVAMGAAGRALAVWGQPRPYLSTVPTLAGLLGRMFLPSGQPLLPRFQATARPVLDDVPALGTDARGEAVLVYQNVSEDGRSTLYLRTYDRYGRERSGEVRLASPGFGPRLAVFPGGRFVVAWQDLGGIRVQRFDPPYRAVGPAIGIDAGRGGSYLADVAGAPDGRFLVAWVETDSLGRQPQILARGFDALGTPLGAAFRVDRPQPSADDDFEVSLSPTVAASGGGTFLVSWVSREPETGLFRLLARLCGTPGDAVTSP